MRIIGIIISLVLFCVPCTIYAKTLDNITLLVSSCDKYSSLWEPFFKSLFRHWPSLQQENKDIPILLIANKKKYLHPRVTMIQIPNEISWGDNMLQALHQIDTKYVMLWLDDYWLNNTVNEQRLLELYHGMQAAKASYMQLAYNELNYQDGPLHPTIRDVNYREKFSLFKVSLQLSIWDIEALRYLLRPHETPWDFELAGSIRSHGYPGDFLTVRNNEPIRHLNAAFQGHIRAEVFTHLQVINSQATIDMPTLGKFNWQITKKLWQHRITKLYHFLKNPSYFYEFS